MDIILKLNLQTHFQLIDSRPGLAGGNMIAASSANKNFKNELMQFDLNGKNNQKRRNCIWIDRF
jgi:hypothetical protein